MILVRKTTAYRLGWPAGVPDVADAESLRQHFESCPHCQRYWQSMCELSERLVNAGDLPQAAPTESFHQSVVLRNHAQGQRTFFSIG